jgi:CheY-like chemotaxis protein
LPGGPAATGRTGAGPPVEGWAGSEPKRPHVLVVDDAPELLALYRELFEGEGYRVSLAAVPATDPGDVARLAPDPIVLDLVFGGEGLGLRFLERIEHDIGIGAPPVVVVSASCQALAARDRFAAAGGWRRWPSLSRSTNCFGSSMSACGRCRPSDSDG